MATPTRSFLRMALNAWSFVIGGHRAGSTDPIPEVIIHDPGAQGAQNLDHPFLDTNAQARVCELIGRAARPGTNEHVSEGKTRKAVI
jgi:hypothetical protein